MKEVLDIMAFGSFALVVPLLLWVTLLPPKSGQQARNERSLKRQRKSWDEQRKRDQARFIRRKRHERSN